MTEKEIEQMIGGNMEEVNEGNMAIESNLAPEQDDQEEKNLNQKLMEIRDERNRLMSSVLKQPPGVLQDIAILAVSWAMRELALGRNEEDPVCWAYQFRLLEERALVRDSMDASKVRDGVHAFQ